MTTVREQGKITSVDDVTRLGIIDFQRTNGYWEDNILHGIQTVADFLINTTSYAIADIDLTRYPIRHDWPGWTHSGSHVELGHLYWNYFFARFEKRSPTLHFSDAPDFHGSFLDNEYVRRNIYGDIGQVSVSTFALEVLPRLRKHDLWVSVLDDRRQVILEPLVDLQDLIAESMSEEWEREESEQDKG